MLYSALFCLGVGLATHSAWLALLWLLGVWVTQFTDRTAARAFLNAGPEDEQRAFARLGLAVLASTLAFCWIYGPLALVGGEVGRLLIILFASVAVLNSVVYLHPTPLLMWCVAGPHGLALFLPALAVARSGEMSWLGVLTLVVVTGVSLNLLWAGYRNNRDLFTNLEAAKHEAEAERAEAQVAAATALAASEAKSRFLANVSHELRTPLNAIIGFAEILEEDLEGVAPASASDAMRIRRAARHLLGLINDVLDHARIEAGKVELRPEALVLSDVLDDIMATAAPLAAVRRNTLSLDCADLDQEIELLADPLRMRQCLLNLLSNACKFTEAGWVTLQVRRQGGDLNFAVIDTGPGIAPSDLARLFQPFVQTDCSLTRAHGGAGLGLVITRQLARLMGGDVMAQSVQGVGSTFTFRMPVRAAERVLEPVA
jgi:signal transduction histidine kinase